MEQRTEQKRQPEGIPQTKWEQEMAHFEECLELIQGNVSYYEKEHEERHAQTAQLLKAMKSGDPEL